MTTTQNRDFVFERLRELGNAYDALGSVTARGTAPATGRRGGGEPPIPIRPAVVDLQREIEREVLRLLSRAQIMLGWSLPPVRLARPGLIVCPQCEADSLFIDRQDWALVCLNPACRTRWSWDQAKLLGEIVAARAMEVAQEVADQLDEDQAQTCSA